MGKGKIQASIFFTEQIEEQVENMVQVFGRGLRLHVHPYLYAYISQGLISMKAKWAFKYGVRLIENQSLGMLETKFFSKNGEEKTLQDEIENDKVCEKH
jgi:ribonuclease G